MGLSDIILTCNCKRQALLWSVEMEEFNLLHHISAIIIVRYRTNRHPAIASLQLHCTVPLQLLTHRCRTVHAQCYYDFTSHSCTHVSNTRALACVYGYNAIHIQHSHRDWCYSYSSIRIDVCCYLIQFS